jgi:ABC-type nitrate/sulfonate/bicarbonate transport system substrate-binding protein
MTRAGFSSFIGNVPFQMVADTYHNEGFHLTFGDNLRLERLIKGDYQIVGVSMNSILMNLEDVLGAAKVIYAYVKAAGDGSDLIVCRGEVSNIERLAQLHIGLQKGSLEHFLFEYLFFSNGVKPQEEYKWMPRSEYFGAMIEGNIDAAIFCDPTLSQILKDDRFQLFGGGMREIALTAVGVLAVRRELLAEREHEISQFVSILLKGMQVVDAADDALLREKAGTFFAGIEKPKETLLSRVAFLTLPENQRLFSTNKPDNLFTRWSQWLEFVRESKFYTVAKPDLKATDILDDTIVKSL